MFSVVLPKTSDTYKIEIMQVSVQYVTNHFGDSTSSDIALAMHDTGNIGTASAVLPVRVVAALLFRCSCWMFCMKSSRLYHVVSRHTFSRESHAAVCNESTERDISPQQIQYLSEPRL